MNRILAKMLCLAVCSLGLSAVIHAEPPVGPGPDGKSGPRKEMMEKHIEKMKADLQLTDDQVAKLKDIFQSHKGDAEKIKQDTVLTKEEKRKQLQQLKEQVDNQINGILTPDQQKKWADIKAQNKEKWAERRKDKKQGGDQTPPPPAPPST
ncbi:MAG: hypothetical protein PHD76_00220 [Methylacidiphilales bacterium]|nr:hypothetical protein [Candidatus Methylacidiphilales bacterium]